MSRQHPNRLVTNRPRPATPITSPTSTGPNSFARPQSDVDYQRQLDLELRERSRQVVSEWLQRGRRVRFVKQLSGQGIGVMPYPRLTPEGDIAWSVR
jgi:hypothetical protein